MDKTFRDWWRVNGNQVKTDHVLLLEWDVCVMGKLPELYTDGVTACEVYRPPQSWYWWKDTDNLPEWIRRHATGIVPLAVLSLHTDFLDVWIDRKYDELYQTTDELFCEMRVPTIASHAGYPVIERPLPGVDWRPVEHRWKTGIYHAVKERVAIQSLHIHVPELGDTPTEIEEFERRGFETVPFDGWNGVRLHPEVAYNPEHAYRQVGNPISRPEYGCLVSHWMAVKESSKRLTLICESDSLVRVSAYDVEQMIERLPARWDVLYLHRFNREDPPPSLVIEQILDRQHHYGGFGYVVNPNSALRLAEAMATLSLPCDLVATRIGMKRFRTLGNCVYWTGRKSTLMSERQRFRAEFKRSIG